MQIINGTSPHLHYVTKSVVVTCTTTDANAPPVFKALVKVFSIIAEVKLSQFSYTSSVYNYSVVLKNQLIINFKKIISHKIICHAMSINL